MSDGRRRGRRSGSPRSGLVLPEVTPPLAAYVPAVRTGPYVYTAGQLPVVDGQLLATGKVGAEVGAARGQRAGPDLRAERAGRRGLGGRRAVGAIRRIVKVTGFVASAPDFTGQPQVINGASELLLEVFGEAGRHARSAVGMAVLPLDAPVEVELIVEVAEIAERRIAARTADAADAGTTASRGDPVPGQAGRAGP